MNTPWQRVRDEIVRRLFGFSPFELEDEIRRLRALVDRLRDEHAREVARLRAAIVRLGGDPDATDAPTGEPSTQPRGNGHGKKRLPVA